MVCRFIERDTTTTSFDMTDGSRLSRYDSVMYATNKRRGLALGAALPKEWCERMKGGSSPEQV